jgi:hypothetical protein
LTTRPFSTGNEVILYVNTCLSLLLNKKLSSNGTDDVYDLVKTHSAIDWCI